MWFLFPLSVSFNSSNTCFCFPKTIRNFFKEHFMAGSPFFCLGRPNALYQQDVCFETDTYALFNDPSPPQHLLSYSLLGHFLLLNPLVGGTETQTAVIVFLDLRIFCYIIYFGRNNCPCLEQQGCLYTTHCFFSNPNFLPPIFQRI